MIDIQVEKDETFRQISLIGHAGYEEKGKDIVCAAASILVYTLIGRLKELEGKNISFNPQSGNTSISMLGRTGETDAAFDTIEAGIKLLAANYPEYVTVHFPDP